MKRGDFIRVVLSSGIKEEGVIEDHRYRDEDGEIWIILAHKNNSNIKLNINKKYVAAYQIDNSIFNEEEKVELKTLVVDDLSLSEPIADPKMRMKKLVDLGLERSETQRQNLKKLIQKPVSEIQIKVQKYGLPGFLKK